VEWAAAGGATLFAIHPLQVEAVAWATGLKDVLSGVLALVAVWQYLCYASIRRDEAPAVSDVPSKMRRCVGHYGLATGAFGLALLAKPGAVTVPLLVWGLDVWVLRRPWREGTKAVLGWLVLAGAWGMLTKSAQPDTLLSFIPPLQARLLIAGDAVTFYLAKLMVPLWLGPHYERSPQVVVALGWSYVTGLVPYGLAIWLWWQRQGVQGLVAAAVVFVGSILPVLGLVPFAFQEHSTVADRYVYVAMLGPAWGLAWGLVQYRRRLIAVGIGVALGMLGVRGTLQTQHWRDTVTLFTHALQVNPRSYLAHNNLGYALVEQGNLAEAIAHYRQALQLKPNFAAAHSNLGLALARQGQLSEAMTHYTEALRLKPNFAVAHNNLGLALARQGQLSEAMTHYAEALRLKPTLATAYNNLGVAYATQGKLAEALALYTQALQLKPAWAPPYNNLGDLLLQQGKPAEAMVLFSQALRLDPTLPDAPYNLGLIFAKQGQIAAAIAAYREAWRRRPAWTPAANSLAWLLATQDNPSLQDVAEALQLAETASQATDYRDATVLHTLAVAYAAAGRLADAIQTAHKALEYAKAAENAPLAEAIQERLRGYERQDIPWDIP